MSVRKYAYFRSYQLLSGVLLSSVACSAALDEASPDGALGDTPDQKGEYRTPPPVHARPAEGQQISLANVIGVLNDDQTIDVSLRVQVEQEQWQAPKALEMSQSSSDGVFGVLYLDGKPATKAQTEARLAQLEQLRLDAVTSLEKRTRAAWKQLSGSLGSDLIKLDERESSATRQATIRVGRARTLLQADPTGLVHSIALPALVQVEDDNTIAQALTLMELSTLAHPASANGTGIGVWMNDGGGKPNVNAPSINPANLILDAVGSDTVQDHATSVVATFMAAAPSAKVHYAISTQGCNLRTASSVLGFSNPPVYLSSISSSYGSSGINYTSCNADWDNFVLTTKIAHFAPAGNRSDEDTAGPVTGAAKSFNVIGVGALDHTVTPIAMRSDSSYADPETGAMKPEIVAPGGDFSVPGVPEPFGATSAATPFAAGYAASLLEGGTVFRLQPALLRAKLMASAQNVVGSAAGSGRDRDGYGQLRYSRTSSNAWHAVASGTSAQVFTEDVNGDGKKEKSYTRSLTAGVTYRFVIAWLVDGNYALANFKPNKDLDLTLWKPDGSNAAGSVRAEQNFEFIEYTPSVSGTYTIRITQFSDAGGPVHLGLVQDW